jgi:hypothetical protein
MLKSMINMVIPETNDILHRVVKTTYAKKAINSLLIILLTILFRSMIYFLISLMIIINNEYINFFTQCIISIILCMNNNYIQYAINKYDDDLYKITKYTINNWSEENYRKWRNYITFSILFLGFIYFSCVEINSNIIRIYILQYSLCHICIDVTENPNHTIRRIFSLKKKEKFYITEKNIPHTDCVLIDKRKIPPSISSEFDIVKENEDGTEFEVIE